MRTSEGNTNADERFLSEEDILAIVTALRNDTPLTSLTYLSSGHLDAISALQSSDPELLKIATTLGTAPLPEDFARYFNFLIFGQVDDDIALRLGTNSNEPSVIPQSRVMVMLRNDWLFRWAFSYVIQDTMVASEEEIKQSREELYWSLVSPMRHPHTATYWIGITVLYLSSTEPWRAGRFFSDEEDFIMWAGKYPDLRSIIKTARERGTTDAETIRHVLDAESGVHSKLRVGIL